MYNIVLGIGIMIFCGLNQEVHYGTSKHTVYNTIVIKHSVKHSILNLYPVEILLIGHYSTLFFELSMRKGLFSCQKP